MHRRDFLRTALSAGVLYGIGAAPWMSLAARADGFAASTHRTVVHLMLSGGPDFRHLFPPAFDSRPSSYGYQHWQARANTHAIADSVQAAQTRWNEDYFHVDHQGVTFGILKSCGWLQRMWDAGNVAIVSNVIVGATRDHSHAILMMDQADHNTGVLDVGRAGWGGRFAAAASGNIVALTPSPRRLCFGPHPSDPAQHDNSNLVAASDTRAMGLFVPPPQALPRATTAIISRSLTAYYQAKRQETARDSTYHRFIEHERILREIGEAVDQRLSGIPVPDAINNLMAGGLTHHRFAEQIRNLYDAFACADLMNMRAASLELKGFDTHRRQREVVEPLFSDLFGDDKALDVLYRELPSAVQDNMVLMIGGEFGRRLRANGDGGTDHGRGNAMLLIGKGIRGGVYGEMFPESELERIHGAGTTITGLTGADRLVAQICNWAAPNSSAFLFPDGFTSPLESGVDLASIFT